MLNDQRMYQSIVGRLIYLTITRPNISYVSLVSQFMYALWTEHLAADLQYIESYDILKGAQVDILYACHGHLNMEAYTDGD